MPRFRCKTCLGEYRDGGPDGTPYFHACPPDVFQIVRNPAGQEREIPRFAAIGPNDTLVRLVTHERANKRDENVIPDPERKRPGTITAPGLGRDEIGP